MLVSSITANYIKPIELFVDINPYQPKYVDNTQHYPELRQQGDGGAGQDNHTKRIDFRSILVTISYHNDCSVKLREALKQKVRVFHLKATNL